MYVRDEAVQKVLSVMLNEVKHPFFRTNKWILQSLRSFRMTFSLFWDNLGVMIGHTNGQDFS